MQNVNISLPREVIRELIAEHDLVLARDTCRYIPEEDAIYAEDIGDYYEESYSLHHCAECGDYVTDYGWNYEQGCCQNCEVEGIIGCWHDESYWYPASDTDKLIGIELEVDGGALRHREQTAHAVRDALGYDAVYFESDSSLSDSGFEIITQPHSFDDLMSLDWEGASEVLRENGYKSHDTSVCGLHLHFSREYFGDTEQEQEEAIALMVKFYEENFDILAILSRRTNFGYCKRDSDATKGSLANVLYKKTYGNRHTAVNLTNLDDRTGTVEYRLGRGTINPKTLRAWIDIHRAITEQSRVATTYTFSEWINEDTVSADTWEWIQARVNYIESKRNYEQLIQNEEAA